MNYSPAATHSIIHEFMSEWSRRLHLLTLSTPASNVHARLILQAQMEQLKELEELLSQTQVRTESIALTPREKEVMQLVIKGLTNKEVAHQLGIKERTVEFHLHAVFHKTHTSNRTEAAAFCVQQGYLST